MAYYACQVTTPVSKEYPWHTQIHRDAYGYGAIPSEVDQRLVVDLRFFGYVKPVFENYVEFSSEITDGFDMPQVRLSLLFPFPGSRLMTLLKPTFHYRIGEEDAERAQAMMKE